MAAQLIGICYGWDGGSDLTGPVAASMALHKNSKIEKIRIYDSKVLGNFEGENFKFIVGIPNTQVEVFASDRDAAAEWFEGVQPYLGKILYIAVGYGAEPRQYEFILPVMKMIHNMIHEHENCTKIKVTTTVNLDILGPFVSPVDASFSKETNEYMKDIAGFLSEVGTKAPLLANIYPYAAIDPSKGWDASFALFQRNNTMNYGPFHYTNLFDLLLDALHSAFKKIGISNLNIVVSETGWPSAADYPYTNAYVNTENAGAYYKNLISHLKKCKGTPMMPEKNIEAYLYAMYDENCKGPNRTDHHFGIFTDDGARKYPGVPDC